MQLQTKTQRVASATSSKSEPAFIVYLYSRMCVRQHGSTLPGSIRLQPELKVSSKGLLWVLKHGCDQQHAASAQAAGQVRHRAGSGVLPRDQPPVSTASTILQQNKARKLHLPEAGNMPGFINCPVEALTSSNEVPTSQASPDFFTCIQE